MPREALEKIRNAEFEAEELIKKANIKAKEILNAAKEDAFRTRERAVMESEEEYTRTIKKLEQDALTEADLLNDKTREQIHAIRREAGQYLSEASEYIVGRILNINADSQDEQAHADRA